MKLLIFALLALAQLVVDAGVDQHVIMGVPPTPFSLLGSVRENGNLVYGLEVSWSKIEGPGDFTVADLNRAITTGYVSLPGVYRFRLTAIDKPPVSTWVNPAEGSSYKTSIVLRGTAIDDLRVRRMELYIDGRWLNTVSSDSIVWTLDIRSKKYKLGMHELNLRACDDMGLCSDNLRTFYKVR